MGTNHPYKAFAKGLMAIGQGTPVLPDDEPNADTDTDTNTHNGSDEPTDQPHYLATPSSVPFELWETLAYDLALATADPISITRAYNITPTELDTLKRNPYFAKILQAKQDEVKQLGSDAAFAVKMRMIAHRATPQLLARLLEMQTSNRDFLAMYKLVTELAQLTPAKDDNAPPPTVIGTAVTFNIGGVPGLDHLSAPKPTSQPTPPVATVDDADWQEVLDHQLSSLYSNTDELTEL